MDSIDSVLQRVADAEETEPSELEEPLYEVVDPDALDALFESFEDGPRREDGPDRRQRHLL